MKWSLITVKIFTNYVVGMIIIREIVKNVIFRKIDNYVLEECI